MRNCYFSLFAFCVLFFISCKNKTEKVIECQKGINLLPMYGRVQKCSEQIASDKEFLKTYDDQGKNRTEISFEYVDLAWYFLHQNEYDTAMKRLNQAWLLDSANLLIYASYTCLLDINKKPDEAIVMMKLAFEKMKQRKNQILSTNPDNDAIMELIISDVSLAYEKTKNLKVARFLYQALDTLKLDDVDNEELKSKLQEEMPTLDL